jgi:hypothetical protein
MHLPCLLNNEHWRKSCTLYMSKRYKSEIIHTNLHAKGLAGGRVGKTRWPRNHPIDLPHILPYPLHVWTRTGRACMSSHDVTQGATSPWVPAYHANVAHTRRASTKGCYFWTPLYAIYHIPMRFCAIVLNASDDQHHDVVRPANTPLICSFMPFTGVILVYCNKWS